MELTRQQKQVDNRLMAYFDHLYKDDPSIDAEVSADNLPFYQKIIFDAAEAKYSFDPCKDPYHMPFLEEFTKHYVHFVVENKGTANDYFMWQTLAYVLINDCLEPEQIENTITRIEEELEALSKSGGTVTEDEIQFNEDEAILEEMHLVLSNFKGLVIETENSFANSDHAGLPVITKKGYARESRDGHNAASTGLIEKKINTFLAPHLQGTVGNEDVNVKMEIAAVTDFYYEIINLITRHNFEFDFLTNRYHIAFLNAFTETYRQQVEDKSEVGQCLLWNRLAGLLINHVEELQPDNINTALNILSEQIQQFHLSDTVMEPQRVLINMYIQTLQDFEHYVVRPEEYDKDVTKAVKKSDYAGVPEFSGTSELRHSMQEAMDIGIIDREIVEFFSPYFPDEKTQFVQTKVDLPSLVGFFMTTIGMMAERGFEFDLLHNKYHVSYVQTFTEAYRSEVKNCDNPRAHFLWKNLAGLLTTYARNLTAEGAGETWTMLDNKIDTLSTSNLSEEEQNHIRTAFSVIDQFGAVVLGDADDNIDFSECQDEADRIIKEAEAFAPALKPRMH